jgi:tetratricopeptide (TPR) repeat protein
MKPPFAAANPTRTAMTRIPRTGKRSAFGAVCAALFVLLATTVSAQESQEINRLIRAGQLGTATTKVDAMLAKNPKDATARFLRGVILAEQGKSNEAINTFQALTEDYPELPEPYNNLASLFAAKGQYEKAKTALEMAIQTNPSYGTAYENLGDVYAKLASQAYDKALQIDKANTAAQAKLAAIRGAFAGIGKTASPQPPATPTKSEPGKPAAAAPAPGSPSALKQTVAAPALSSGAAAAAPGDSTAIMQAVNAWVGAWAARDLDNYLGAYSKAFAPEGKSRDQWEAARRASFPAARSVHVSIEQTQINMIGESEAEVTFLQHFRSERAKLNTRKLLRLSRENGVWHIAQERILH